MRLCFHDRGVLLIWLLEGQGPTTAVVGGGGGATGGIFIRPSQPRDGQAFPGFEGDVSSNATVFNAE